MRVSLPSSLSLPLPISLPPLPSPTSLSLHLFFLSLVFKGRVVPTVMNAYIPAREAEAGGGEPGTA